MATKQGELPMTATAAVRKSRGPWQWGLYAKTTTRSVVPILLWTLHDLGGEITDEAGRCSTKLVAEAVKRGFILPRSYTNAASGALSQLLAELDTGRRAGCITRERNAKRTFKITLLLTDDEMPPKPHPVKVSKVQPTVEPIKPKQRPIAPVAVFVPKDEDEGLGNGGPDPDYQPEPEVPEPLQPEPFQPELPDDPDTPDVDDVTVIPPLLTVSADDDAFMLILEASQLLARAMIATNARTPKTGPSDADIDDAARRMADTLAENQRLRRQLNEARETANARSKECEGLRKALLVAQGNLRAFQANMGQADGREKALARLRDTQRTMAAPPTRRG